MDLNSPKTRIESFLAKIAGIAESAPDVPLTRIEAYLSSIADNAISIEYRNLQSLIDWPGYASYSVAQMMTINNRFAFIYGSIDNSTVKAIGTRFITDIGDDWYFLGIGYCQYGNQTVRISSTTSGGGLQTEGQTGNYNRITFVAMSYKEG